MPILSCYVDEQTHARLERFSQETGRPVDELAEALISEGALNADLHNRAEKGPVSV